MNKILYLDCGMGAAGDMLGAALYELLDDTAQKKYMEEINSCGIEDVTVLARPDSKAGIAGTHMSVMIDGVEEGAVDHNDHDHGEHDHDHHHDHDHGEHDHHHHHTSLEEVHGIINATAFSDRVKRDACAVYDMIAQAESKAHNTDVTRIHFHEVGMKDAIVDVLGVCRLIELLDCTHIYASPIRCGFGEVKCAHGIVPVPAPATAYLLEGIPVYAGDIRGEMCTPTGAALLKYFVTEYMNMPDMMIGRTGYGCGTRDFERANIVRAVLGSESVQTDIPQGREMSGVVELATNLDDMTGEALAYAAETMRSEGALDVFYTPVYMKKNRPGYMLTVLCREEDEDRFTALFFKNTSTWGIRRRIVERSYMETHIETVDTKYGPVRFKTGEGYGATKTKPEYEDIARIASERGMSVNEVMSDVIVYR